MHPPEHESRRLQDFFDHLFQMEIEVAHFDVHPDINSRLARLSHEFVEH